MASQVVGRTASGKDCDLSLATTGADTIPLTVVSLTWALTGAACTATPPAGKPVQDKPEKTVDRVTTVSVSLEGTDSIGARLGTKLKERFNQSSLFTLNDDEEKDMG